MFLSAEDDRKVGVRQLFVTTSWFAETAAVFCDRFVLFWVRRQFATTPRLLGFRGLVALLCDWDSILVCVDGSRRLLWFGIFRSRCSATFVSVLRREPRRLLGSVFGRSRRSWFLIGRGTERWCDFRADLAVC